MWTLDHNYYNDKRHSKLGQHNRPQDKQCTALVVWLFLPLYRSFNKEMPWTETSSNLFSQMFLLLSIALLLIHAVTESLLRAGQKNLSLLLKSGTVRINIRNCSKCLLFNFFTLSWATGRGKLARGNPHLYPHITGGTVFLTTLLKFTILQPSPVIPRIPWKTTREQTWHCCIHPLQTLVFNQSCFLF